MLNFFDELNKFEHFLLLAFMVYTRSRGHVGLRPSPVFALTVRTASQIAERSLSSCDNRDGSK